MMNNLDSIFLEGGERNRAAFLRHMLQSSSYGCRYIFLWSHFPLPYNSKCLVYFDGVYTEEQVLVEQQPSLARRLFDTYSESVNYVDQGGVPGFAFNNNLPYIEFKLDCLLRLASSQVQIQFYQEAGIKTAVFIGCNLGEIEIGMSTDPPVNLKMEIQNLFPVNISSSSRETTDGGGVLHLQSLHTTPSSSLSVDSSSDYSYSYSYPYHSQETLFNSIPSHSQETFLEEALMHHQHQNIMLTNTTIPPSSAFTAYHRKGADVIMKRKRRQGSHSMFKRSVLLFRNLSLGRGNHFNPIQVQHMISERRRREKLNSSFQALRSLLPPGSKKDKASVLSSITDQLISLKSQVETLSEKNRELESKLGEERMQVMASLDCFSAKAINVEILHDPEFDSGMRFLSLSFNSKQCGMLDLVDKVMELLKEQRGVLMRLVSIQSNTRLGGENEDSIHGLVLRLKVEGNEEFNESALKEAWTKAVDELPH